MTNSSIVQALAEELSQGLEALTPDDSETVWGVNDRGAVFGSRSLALTRICEILVKSGRVFNYEDSIVLEKHSDKDGKRLIALLQGDRLLPAAPSHVSTLFHCATLGKDTIITYQPPAKIISEVLNQPARQDKLPRISYYRRLPVFNKNFELCGPGYHEESQILVHCDTITPIPFEPPQAEKAIDRLPPGLRGWLQDFCFDTNADLVNALAMTLTGILMNHLIEAGKPSQIITGNQRSIGKTLLAATTGIILDGEVPPLIHHTDDEDEFAKRLGAKIKRSSPFSVLFSDNRKGSIGGGLLESLALAPRVSVRRLGYNEDISRVNDFIWIFTANNARATTDMTSRSVITHLQWEGDPRVRFAGTGKEEEALKAYVREHRQQILGEFIGMVIRWRDAGKPLGCRAHRCKRWAELIGGILQVACLPEFLANQDEAVIEIDEDLQELITLAEHVIDKNRHDIITTGGDIHITSIGKKAAEWVSLFRDAKVRGAELQAAGSERLQATVVGTFFSARLNRPVPVVVGDCCGTAVLRAQPGRSRQRRYWIVVTWDTPAVAPQPDVLVGGQGTDSPPPPPPPSPPGLGDSDQKSMTTGGNGLEW